MPKIRLHKSRSFFERAIKNRQKKTTTRSFVNWWRSFSLKGGNILNYFESLLGQWHSITLSFFFCSLPATTGFAWREIVGTLEHTSQRSLPIGWCGRRTGTAACLSLAMRPEAPRRCHRETSTDASWSIPSIRQISLVCLVLWSFWKNLKVLSKILKSLIRSKLTLVSCLPRVLIYQGCKRVCSEQESNELSLLLYFVSICLSGTKTLPLQKATHWHSIQILMKRDWILPNGWILIFSIASDTNRPQVIGFTSPVQQL